MLIGIISDTHSRYSTVIEVARRLEERKVGCVIHCGDIEDSQTVRLFQGLPIHFVFGNCDHDRAELRRVMGETGAVLHEPFGSLEVDARQIAWTHGDDKRLFRDLENSDFDYVFYGHTHVAEEHQVGRTSVINPGALHRARPKSFVILDTQTGLLERVELQEL